MTALEYFRSLPEPCRLLTDLLATQGYYPRPTPDGYVSVDISDVIEVSDLALEVRCTDYLTSLSGMSDDHVMYLTYNGQQLSCHHLRHEAVVPAPQE